MKHRMLEYAFNWVLFTEQSYYVIFMSVTQLFDIHIPQTFEFVYEIE